MELRAKQYEEIISRLRSGAADRGRSAERRAGPRVGLRAQIQLLPCRTGFPGTAQPAWVRDISRDGIGLVFHEALDPGTAIVLRLPDSRSQTLVLLFDIVRCTPLGNGQFSLGARFKRLVNSNDAKHQPHSSTAPGR